MDSFNFNKTISKTLGIDYYYYPDTLFNLLVEKEPYLPSTKILMTSPFSDACCSLSIFMSRTSIELLNPVYKLTREA